MKFMYLYVVGFFKVTLTPIFIDDLVMPIAFSF